MLKDQAQRNTFFPFLDVLTLVDIKHDDVLQCVPATGPEKVDNILGSDLLSQYKREIAPHRRKPKARGLQESPYHSQC